MPSVLSINADTQQANNSYETFLINLDAGTSVQITPSTIKSIRSVTITPWSDTSAAVLTSVYPADFTSPLTTPFTSGASGVSIVGAAGVWIDTNFFVRIEGVTA
jgi:hypothetical protein